MDGYLLQVPQLDSFQKWILLCAGVLTLIYVVLRPFKRKKDPLGRAPNLSLSGQRAVEKQMTELLVELEQMARQMTAQLETRAAKLELLLREADEKLALLRAAVETPAQTSAAETTANQTPRLDVAPGLRPPAPANARHSQVYDLSDQGLSPRQIAQHLSRPNGEIELILALRGHLQAEMPCPDL